MQVKDITDQAALKAVQSKDLDSLNAPDKVILRKLESLLKRQLIDYGVGIFHSWLTPEGKQALEPVLKPIQQR